MDALKNSLLIHFACIHTFTRILTMIIRIKFSMIKLLSTSYLVCCDIKEMYDIG